MKTTSPDAQLAGFIARFTPEIAACTRAVLEKMRARLPGATELVYDNYYALVVGFCPADRASEVIFSVAVYPRHVGLCFFAGDKLPDPHKLLEGGGKVARHIRIDDPKTLDKPAVKALMKAALACAPRPIDPKQPRRIEIRTTIGKNRSRRPKGK